MFSWQSHLTLLQSNKYFPKVSKQDFLLGQKFCELIGVFLKYRWKKQTKIMPVPDYISLSRWIYLMNSIKKKNNIGYRKCNPGVNSKNTCAQVYPVHFIHPWVPLGHLITGRGAKKVKKLMGVSCYYLHLFLESNYCFSFLFFLRYWEIRWEHRMHRMEM